MLADAFSQAHDELIVLARENSLHLRDLATTLTVVIAMPDCLGVAQTGDGLVVALEPDGSLLSCTQPQRGEYANETYFITGIGGGKPRFLEVFPATAGFAVVTDGLLPVASDLSTGEPHDPFFMPFFDVLQTRRVTPKTQTHLTDFLTSARVAERVDDDLTLVVATYSDSSCQPNES